MISEILITSLMPLAIHIPPTDPNVPARQPFAAAAYGQAAVAYGAGNSIYFAHSSDDGRTFSEPVKVADVNVLALGRHRAPRVTILKDAILVSAVVGEHLSNAPHAHGLPSDGNLTVWRSTDKGRTWSRMGVVNDAPGAAREGFHSIAADAQDRLTAVWLDLREKGTKLYSSRSLDGGKAWTKNVLLYSSPDGTICECCNASVAADANGAVAVMWRNVLAGSRDFYTIVARDGVHFGAPQKSGSGTWKINACPMDGGGLALRDGQMYSAWRREKDVFFVPPGKAEVKIGTGNDVALASSPEGIYVAWTGSAGPDRNDTGIVLAKPNSHGVMPGNPALIAPGGAFVTLTAATDGGVLAAWEKSGTIEIQKIQ